MYVQMRFVYPGALRVQAYDDEEEAQKLGMDTLRVSYAMVKDIFAVQKMVCLPMIVFDFYTV